MNELVSKIKVIGNLIAFSLFIYLIVIGQKNIGLVIWIGDTCQITNLKPIGLCIMVIAMLGILYQLFCYNKKFQ